MSVNRTTAQNTVSIGNGVYGQSDVAIVGGGLAGLTAACYLARDGHSVALFERANRLGGLAASQNDDGFIFNRGAHALYEKSIAVQVLRDLGVSFTSGNPSNVRAAHKDKLHIFPGNPLDLLRTSLLTPAAKWETARLFMNAAHLEPRQLADVTLADWLRDHVRHKTVRQFLEASTRVAALTNAPDQLSAGLAIEQLQIAMGKIHYVDSGWQTLVDGLTRQAQAAGASLCTGSRIARITRTESGPDGYWDLWLDDSTSRTYRARCVILATGPKPAAGLVDSGSAEGRRLHTWAANVIPVKAAALDVALRRLPRPENPVVISIDRPLFLTAQSSFSRVTPEGGALVYTLKYLHPSDSSDPAADERELEAWLDLGQPGWRAELIKRQYLPNITVNNALVTAAQGGTWGRPEPQVPGADGLFVAGDWVGSHSTLAGASLSSAQQAARLASNWLAQRQPVHIRSAGIAAV